MLTPERVPVTVVGLARFGDDRRVGGVTYVAFDTDTAQRLLTGGDHSSSGSSSAPTTASPPKRSRSGSAPTLPDGVEAITGAELTAEQRRDVESDFLGFFQTVLLAFAGIAIVVAAFSIHNTFSILVAQRTRESALMRAIGASRRQVVVCGRRRGDRHRRRRHGDRLRAPGSASPRALQSAMESGLDMPDAGLVIGAGAIVASAIVGIGTTVLASVGPALKASRVAPLAALRDVAVDRSGGLVVAGRGRA